jgi:ABC-type lipoprotein export system ATPase subunit
MSALTDPDHAPPRIELRDLTRQYASVDDATPGERVLDGVNLSVAAGGFVAVVGPSGSGKTTLMNIIGLLDQPTAGAVLLDGEPTADLDEASSAALRSRRVGFVFQLHHLLPQCTALENVLTPTLARGTRRDRSADFERAAALLDRVGLADQRHHRPGQLSGGQCQRVAVARALINEPDVLLADEPTGSLDQRTSEQIGDLLAELNQQRGLTLVMVTHNRTLAHRAADRYTLTDGRLVSERGTA